jgi:hypothetical protein
LVVTLIVLVLINTDQSVCRQVQFFFFSILGFDHLTVP